MRKLSVGDLSKIVPRHITKEEWLALSPTFCVICNEFVEHWWDEWQNPRPTFSADYRVGGHYCSWHNIGAYMLTFHKLHVSNVARCEDVFHPIDGWSPTDWATAMAGEFGEACNLIKKLRRLDGADSNLDTPAKRAVITDAIADELADLIIYADLLAERLSINLADAVIDRFNEVSRRKGSKITL